MALMDKMKAQAAQLAQKAQEAGKAGQSKLGDVQARRKADALLRELGAIVYAQRTGTAAADAPAEIDRLVGEIKALENESGPLESASSDADSSDTTTKSEPPTEGDFKL